MSNYPPGVTGNEWQIAGPSAEFDEEREVVHECDDERFDAPFEGTVEGTITRWDYEQTFTYECPKCGAEVDIEEDAEDYLD